MSVIFLSCEPSKKCCVVGNEFFYDVFMIQSNKLINKRGVSDYMRSVNNIQVSKLPRFALQFNKHNHTKKIKKKAIRPILGLIQWASVPLDTKQDGRFLNQWSLQL